MNSEKKRGLKLTIIDSYDWEDFSEVATAIVKLGYTGTMIDNGNIVFTKESSDSKNYVNHEKVKR
jgi:hypothetical protein